MRRCAAREVALHARLRGRGGGGARGVEGGEGGIGICHDYRKSMRNMILRDIPGVGRQTAEKLELSKHKLVEVAQVWGLGKDGRRVLQQLVGVVLGQTIYDCCHGRDDRKVQPQKRKSIGAECNYGIRCDGRERSEAMSETASEESIMHEVAATPLPTYPPSYR